MSLDDEVSAALTWAKKEKFPWPHVLSKDLSSCELNKFASRGVPHYALIDKTGKLKAVGKQQSFAIIDRL